MSMINVENLTFAYDGSYDNIFENVCFRIDTDWKLGFTGRNGRGKTTFLKLLMGGLEYRGNISSSVNFEYFPFEIEDDNEITIDICEKICPTFEHWELMRELNLLNVEADVLYRPFNTLSNGERTKVMLAVLFLKENSFLLIDEPTNHLDADGRITVGKYLNRKKGFILVSHDRVFLDSCIDHILSINRADIVIEKGNYSSWEVNKENRDNFETIQNEKLKREIKGLEKAAKSAAEHSNRIEREKIGFDPKNTEKSISRRSYLGAKSKKLMSRSKAIETRIEADIAEKSNLLKNVEYKLSLKIPSLAYHSKTLLYAQNLTINYGSRNVCENVSFSVNSGERILIKGRNGSGKSSILKLICGYDIPHSGNISLGSRLVISYVSQDFSHLSGTLSEFASSAGIDENLFRAILCKLGFSAEQLSKRIENYSGGQKKKVLIASSLSTPAHLYVWDEPLNFIDINSRIQIEELIDEFKPTMIFVEHDIAFQRKIATSVIEI